MCAALARRLLQSLCGFLLNLILRLPWRQAAPVRTCDLGPLIQETLQLSLLAPFQHQGCGGGDSRFGELIPSYGCRIQGPSCPPAPSPTPLLSASTRSRQSTPKPATQQGKRREGTKAGDGTDPMPQLRTCRAREGMQNSRQRGKDKGHKDGSLQESTERQLMKKGLWNGLGRGRGRQGRAREKSEAKDNLAGQPQ